MSDRNKIIDFDFQGWPLCKMSIRELLNVWGFKLNEEANKLEISNDDKILDVFPTRFIEDGMGYGVEEEKIVDTYVNEERNFVSMFTWPELKNIQIWLEDKVQPNEQIVYNGKEYFVKDLKDYGTNTTVNYPDHDPDYDPNDDPDQERFKYELCPDLFNDNIVDNIVITREEMRKAMEKR